MVQFQGWLLFKGHICKIASLNNWQKLQGPFSGCSWALDCVWQFFLNKHSLSLNCHLTFLILVPQQNNNFLRHYFEKFKSMFLQSSTKLLCWIMVRQPNIKTWKIFSVTSTIWTETRSDKTETLDIQCQFLALLKFCATDVHQLLGNKSCGSIPRMIQNPACEDSTQSRPQPALNTLSGVSKSLCLSLITICLPAQPQLALAQFSITVMDHIDIQQPLWESTN